MIFSSLSFLIFFSVVVISLSTFKSQTIKKWILLSASYFFYGYWDYRFLSLIIVSTLIDFYIGRYIPRVSSEKSKKRLMIASIVANLGILGFFKYFNFFIDSLNVLLTFSDIRLETLNIILPVGISFYTFQTMSYTIDIYRKRIDPAENFLDFAIFVAFFPQLVAGPIVRAIDFLPQLKNKIEIKLVNLTSGLQIFLVGMVKKLVIADNLASYIDFIYSKPQLFDSLTIWISTISYSIQILADFSGYSDMAIGIALCLGYKLPINFKTPYLSLSITEFWRRWHISLSSWLRDYLYISLGGNRSSQVRTYINLMLTMLLGGLWHGASWNFVIWGLIHGLGLAVHKKISSNKKPKSTGIISIFVSWLSTYIFVLITWVFFRAHSLTDAVTILKIMMNPLYHGTQYLYSPLLIVMPLVAIFLYFKRFLANDESFYFKKFSIVSCSTIIFAIITLLFFSPIDSTPFIYFQF